MPTSTKVSLMRGVFAVALSLALVNGTAPAYAASTVVAAGGSTSAVTLGAAETLTWSGAGSLNVTGGPAVTITGSGASINTTGAAATAIALTAGTDSTVSIGSTGTNATVTVASGTAITNATANAAILAAATGLVISNSGTISNTSTGSAIKFANGATATINNSGTISANAAANTAIDNSANASAVTLNMAAGSTITGAVKLGSGDDIININGTSVTWTAGSTITTAANGKGTLNIKASFTLPNATTTVTNIGSSAASLAAINISDGANFTIAQPSSGSAGTNIYANTVTLGGSSGTLTLGTGGNTGGGVVINGNVVASSDGQGVLTSNAGAGSAATNGNLGKIAGNVGTSSAKIGTVTVVDGKQLAVTGSFYANNVTLGSTTGASASTALQVNGPVLSGVINAFAGSSGAGSLYLGSSGATTTLAAGTSVGATTPISAFVVLNGATVDAATNNNPIYSSEVQISANGLLKIGSGALTGSITGIVLTTNRGTAEFTQDFTLGATNCIGTAYNTSNSTCSTNRPKLASVIVDDGKTLNAAVNNMNMGTDAVVLGSGSGANAKLILGTQSFTPQSGTLSTVDGFAAGKGVLEFAGSQTLTATVGGTNALAQVIVDDGKVVTASTNNNVIKATQVTLGNSSAGGAKLILGTGSVTGKIDGNAAGKGILEFAGNNTTNGNIGASYSLASLIVDAGKTVNAATNNNSINASQVTLTAGSALKIGTGAITGLVDGDAAGNGTLEIADNNTLGATIGSNFKLGALLIDAGKTLDAATNAKAISANQVTLASGATFKVGGAAVSGPIDGAAAGQGTLKISGNFTTSSTVGGTNKLASVTVDNGATLTAANAINASATTVSGGGTMNLGAPAVTVTGDVVDNGTIALGTSVLTVASGSVTGSGTLTLALNTGSTHGYIVNNSGSTDLSALSIAPTWGGTGSVADGAKYVLVQGYNGVGIPATVVSPSASNGTWTVSVYSGPTTTDADGVTMTAGDLILTASAGYVPTIIVVNDGTTLDKTPSTPIVADQVTLGNAGAGTAVLKLGSGSVTGPIDGDVDGAGILEIAGDNTLKGTVGATHSLALVKVDAGYTLDAATNNEPISATQVTLYSGSKLVLGTSSVKGKIDGDVAGDGTLEIAGSNTLNGNVGSAFSLASVLVDAGKTLDASVNNNSIAATQVTLNAGAKLKLGTGAVTGKIDGDAANHGILEIAGNNTTNGNIGSSFALASVIVDDGKTLDAATSNNSIAASAISLGNTSGGSNATLKLGTGAVTGSIDGFADGKGILEIAGNNILAGAVGASHGLASVVVDAGKTLDAATNNKSIKATQVTLANGASLKVGTAAVTGAIDGDTAGHGNVEFTGNYALSGAVGANKALASLQIDSGKTLTAGAYAISANQMSLAGGSTLKLGTGAVTGAIDGIADNNGTLEIAANNTLSNAIGAVHALSAVAIDNGATLTLSNAIKAASTTIASGGKLTLGASAVTVTGNLVNNGTVALGTNVLTVASGAVTGSGSLTLTLNSGATHGYIVNDSASTSLSAMTIAPSWGGTGSVANGAAYLVVQNYAGAAVSKSIGALAGSNGTFTLQTWSGADTLDAQNGQTIHAGDLVLVAASTAATGKQGIAPDNAAPVDALTGYTGTDASTLNLQSKVNALTAPADVDQAGAQLRPDVSGVASQAAFAAGNQFLNVVGEHSEAVRSADAGGSGVSTGEAASGGAIWGRFFGSSFTQDRTQGIDGYTGDTWGIALGIDKFVAPSVRVGVAGGFASTDVSDAGTRSGSRTQISSYFGTLDASYNSMARWYVDGALTYGRHGYTSYRYISLIAQTAQGDFTGDQFGGRISAGYPLPLGRSTLTPVLSADYNLFRQGGYTENGAAGANLTVGDSQTHSLRSGLGLKFTTSVFGEDFRPNAHGAWYHEFNDKAPDVAARFAVPGGPSFKAAGIKIGTEDFNVGGGFDLLLDDDVTLSAQYDYDIRDSYSANTGQVQLHVNF